MSRRFVFWTLAALAVLAAALQAWILRWTCDDAFISFRYAQHFVDGHGLVFNLDPGERPVEGYTNFTWTMWLALGLLLGCTGDALETWAIAWGILCHAGVVWLLAAVAWSASAGRALVPIAACAYAAIHHGASLAPAGLETALFVLLATAMLRHVFLLRCLRDAWLLGFLGVLAAMTRPDGAVFGAVLGAFVLFDAWRRRAPLLLVGYGLPFVAVFGPYLLWRHAYYGFWLPNTFHAKSGGDPHLEQGMVYVADFLWCYWPLLGAFVLLVTFAVCRPGPMASIQPFHGRRPWLAIAACVLAYLGFVVWVGGDFMFGRFLLPILPALLIGFDLACQRWRAAWLQPGLAAVVVLGFVFRVEPPGLDNHLADVSDNRTISFNKIQGIPFVDAFRGCGDYLRPLFAGLDVRIAIAGGHANLAYRSRVPVAIECAAGLTDAHIARLPAPERGKRGHDKPRDPRYLERRGVHFMAEPDYEQVDAFRAIWFPSLPLPLPMALVTWDRELMRELLRRDPRIQVQDFERYLDAYLAELPNKDKAQVRADFAKFRRFYFDHEDDSVRRQAFEAFCR